MSALLADDLFLRRGDHNRLRTRAAVERMRGDLGFDHHDFRIVVGSTGSGTIRGRPTVRLTFIVIGAGRVVEELVAQVLLAECIETGCLSFRLRPRRGAVDAGRSRGLIGELVLGHLLRDDLLQVFFRQFAHDLLPPKSKTSILPPNFVLNCAAHHASLSVRNVAEVLDFGIEQRPRGWHACVNPAEKCLVHRSSEVPVRLFYR